jgi:hypothetical protein
LLYQNFLPHPQLDTATGLGICTPEWRYRFTTTAVLLTGGYGGRTPQHLHALVSYGLSLDALQDFLPLDLTLDVKTVRYDTLKVAKRLEAELGDEHPCFIDGSPSNLI